MIDLTKVDKVFLYPGYVSFRLGINGLRNLIENKEEKAIYVFCNKNKTSLKIIEIAYDSCWLYYKKLLRGRFLWPVEGEVTSVDKKQIEWIIDGLTLINSIQDKNKKIHCDLN